MNTSIGRCIRMYALMGRSLTTPSTWIISRIIPDITATLNRLADFGFFSPIPPSTGKAIVFDVPLCWSIRSIFDMFDGVDQLSESSEYLVRMDILITLLPQMRAQMPPMTAMTTMRDMMLIWHGTLGAFYKQQEE